MKFAVLIAAITLSASPVSAMSAWDDWYQISKNECPNHHVEWTCDGCHLNITEAFEGTLTTKEFSRVERIANSDHYCADAGLDCGVGRSLIAYRRLGIMRRFAKFSCRVVKCEEPAFCSRMPPGP